MKEYKCGWTEKCLTTMLLKGVSVKQLSRAVGFSPEYTSSVVHGHVTREKARLPISEYLGISCSDKVIIAIREA